MICVFAWGDQSGPGWLAYKTKQLSHTATWILTAISKTHVWEECYSTLSVCAHSDFQSWLELHTDTVLKEIWVHRDMLRLKNAVSKDPHLDTFRASYQGRTNRIWEYATMRILWWIWAHPSCLWIRRESKVRLLERRRSVFKKPNRVQLHAEI